MKPKATRATKKVSVEALVEAPAKQPIIIGAPTQIIYADRIMNMGIGVSVSRLTLAMEVGENTFNPFAQLVIPTPNLMEALVFMSQSLNENDDMKKAILDGLDALRTRLTESNP